MVELFCGVLDDPRKGIRMCMPGMAGSRAHCVPVARLSARGGLTFARPLSARSRLGACRNVSNVAQMEGF